MTGNTNDGGSNKTSGGSQSGMQNTGGNSGSMQGGGQGTSGSDQYPKWNKSWQDKLGEVDNQIVDFYSKEGANSDELPSKIGSWFETQEMDNETTAEFNKAKQTPDFMKQQVQGRVDYLNQQGKLKHYQGGMQQGQSGQSGQQGQGAQYSQQGQGNQGQSGQQGSQYSQQGQSDQQGQSGQQGSQGNKPSR